jgi:hypothetical protein
MEGAGQRSRGIHPRMKAAVYNRYEADVICHPGSSRMGNSEVISSAVGLVPTKTRFGVEIGNVVVPGWSTRKLWRRLSGKFRPDPDNGPIGGNDGIGHAVEWVFDKARSLAILCANPEKIC